MQMETAETLEEQRLISASLRKKGILEENKRQMVTDQPAYAAERLGGEGKVLCTNCSGFYSRSVFYRHKIQCAGDSAIIPRSVALADACRSDTPNSVFITSVLSRIQNDAVGSLVKNDQTIRLIGERLFERVNKKVDKEMETRKTVMAEMRYLGRLFLAFKGHNNADDSADMFHRKNFADLERAIEEVCDSDGLKHGVKYRLYYILRNAAIILKGSYLSKMEDEKANEVEIFIQLLSLNQNHVFGNASQAISRNRQEKLRMPEQQADEAEVRKLRDHILQRIQTLSEPYEVLDIHGFISLRDSLCARITLFNARRGGEPSRLKIKQWEDALNKRWIDQEAMKLLQVWELKVFENGLICYMAGKGNKLVPVIFPKDCIGGMKKICDPATRLDVGILPIQKNPYVFANTGKSIHHVTGWECINKMCVEAGIQNPDLLTATKQRHRISTKFAQLDLPDTDRDLFFSHMGHSGEVNRGTYQYPLPIQQMTRVGVHLSSFDSGEQIPLAQ